MTRRLLVVGLLLMIALGGGTAFLLTTETGLRWGFERLRPFLPETFAVAEVSGRAIGPLEFRGIHLQGPGYEARLERLHLDWRPTALLRGVLDFDSIRGEGLSYTRIPGAEAPGGDGAAPLRPEDWAPPLALRVRELTLEQSRFHPEPEGPAYRLSEVAARLGASGERLYVRGLRATGPETEARGRASLGLQGEQAVAGRLDWTLRPTEGEALRGETTVRGTLRDRVHLNQEVSGPATASLQASLDRPFTRLRWHLEARARNWEPGKWFPQLAGTRGSFRLEAKGDAGGGEGRLRLEGSEAEQGTFQGFTDFHFQLDGPLLAIPELRIHAEDLGTTLAARGRLEGPLDDPRWRAQADLTDIDLARLDPELPAVRGELHARASGGLDTAEGRLSVLGEEPRAGAIRGETAFRARREGPEVALSGLAIRSERFPGAVTGSGTLRQEGTHWQADLEGDWQGLRWPPEGQATLASPAGSWTVAGTPEDLTATLEGLLQPAGRFQARARYRPEALEGAVHWSGIRLPGVEPAITLTEGHLEASGTPDDYRVHLQGSVEQDPERRLRVEVNGRGDTQGLAWGDLQAGLMGGVIRGQGHIGWADIPEAQANLQAEGLDPGEWSPVWPGRLDGALTAQATFAGGTPRIEVSELTVNGTLREQPVSGLARGQLAGERLDLETLEIQSGESELSASGSVGEELAIQWGIRSPDLGQLSPDVAGRFEGRGELTGTLTAPDLSARATGRDLTWLEHRIGALELDTTVRLGGSGEAESRLDLTVTDAEVAGAGIGRLRVSGSGTVNSHRLSAEAETELGQARAALDGQWQAEGETWGFQLRELRLQPAALPETWTLHQPATGEVGAGRLSLEETCLSAGDPLLCLGGSQEGDTSRVSFRARALPLNRLRPWLPPDTRIEGELEGEGELTRTGEGQPTGRAELRTTEGRLTTSREGDDGEEAEDEEGVTLQTFRPSRLTVTADADRIRAEGALDLSGEDTVRVDLGLGSGPEPWADSPLSGEIQGRMTELAVVSRFVPEITELSGQLEADLRLAGTLGSPDLQGELRFSGKRVALATPGITVRDLEATIEPTPEGNLRLQAQATSEGTLRAEGTGRFWGGERWLELTLKGQDFRAVDTPEARIWASPDLAFRLDQDLLAIDGEIRIPRAEITPKGLPEKGAVTVSQDQVIVRPEEESPATAMPLRIRSRVRVVLGNKVHFQGFGLETQIAGELTIREEPGETTTATGELRTVEGSYRAYGQNLDIQTGKLVFGGGPISHPGLDVRAVRRPREGITVGVLAQGPLRKPRFSLFSEPPMDQSDQLSYLVLGRPMEQTSDDERNSISQAAILLGAKGGQGMAQNVGDELGLDQVTVESRPGETGEQAAVVLGKYLSPRLFVSYGVGLFEAVNTLRMTYTLGQHWEVVTESNAVQTGGDLFWTTESGGR